MGVGKSQGQGAGDLYKATLLFTQCSELQFTKKVAGKITQKQMTFQKASNTQLPDFTEVVHVLPTLNDFPGSPMCEKGSDFMEEGNGRKKLQKGEKYTREFSWLFASREEKGKQMQPPQSHLLTLNFKRKERGRTLRYSQHQTCDSTEFCDFGNTLLFFTMSS